MTTSYAREKPRFLWRILIAATLLNASALAEVSAPHVSATSSTTAAPASSPLGSAAPASTILEAAPPTPATTDSAATQFAETCSGCHTIGGGVSRGPDLAQVAAWPDAQLAQAIKTMERKVGPLSAAQVEALVGLLKDKDVQARIAKARAKFTNALTRPTQAPDSLLGGALFFGHEGLQNGGMACSSCHRFRGEGGDLGPDLSRFGELTELEALASTIARASFPVMRAAYAAHPITELEAQHLAAFMKQAKAERYAASGSHPTIVGFGVGLGAFALALVAILSRPKGVRARLIERATKR